MDPASVIHLVGAAVVHSTTLWTTGCPTVVEPAQTPDSSPTVTAANGMPTQAGRLRVS